MRRYKLAVHILVILSVFNFVSVLAAPIAAQKTREAYADMADEGEVVLVVSRKRTLEGQDSSSGYHGLAPASPDSGSIISDSGPFKLVSVPLSSDRGSSPPPSEMAGVFHQGFRPNTEIGPASSSSSESGDVPPSNLAQTSTVTEQPKPQSKSVLGNLASKSKTFWNQLVRVSKGLFRELVDNPKLQIRTSNTNSGAVNAAEAYVSTYFPKLQTLT